MTIATLSGDLGGMKKAVKTSLFIIGFALVAGFGWLVWLGTRPDDSVAESVPDTSRGPSFEVRVVMPRAGLPLGGILPDWLVKKLDGTPRQLGFDHTSSGARIVSAAPDRLELTAGSWDLLIETDGAGRVTSGTELAFPLGLGGRQVRLSCRPADRALGYLHTSTPTGSDYLAGRFLVEFASCKNADSGKAIEWPPAPLTVRGSFVALPHGRG